MAIRLLWKGLKLLMVGGQLQHTHSNIETKVMLSLMSTDALDIA